MAELTNTIERGDLLFSEKNSYLLLNFMGEGTFGRVFRCMNLTTKEEVAVKVIKKKKTSDNEVDGVDRRVGTRLYPLTCSRPFIE